MPPTVTFSPPTLISTLKDFGLVSVVIIAWAAAAPPSSDSAGTALRTPPKIISMGIGTIVIGLAAVIIGENLLPSRRLIVTTLAVILGAVLYRFFITLALSFDALGLQSQDLNFVTAALVSIVLVLPLIKRRILPKKASGE